MLGEVVKAPFKRGQQVGKSSNIDIGSRPQCTDVVSKTGLLDLEDLVGAPAGEYIDSKTGVFCDLAMIDK